MSNELETCANIKSPQDHRQFPTKKIMGKKKKRKKERKLVYVLCTTIWTLELVNSSH